MKIEPPMFRQIVDCMDQLLEVYKFNLNAADCTPFNGSIIKSALSSKIAQLNSLRQLFIDKYNSSCFEDVIKEVKKMVSDDDFLYELLKDGMTRLLNQTFFDGSKYFVELNLRMVNKESNRIFTAIRTKGSIYEL